MVESTFVNAPSARAAPPIGVLRSLATGFDRVAARPWLALPAFLLDIFLWLGPRVRITPLIDQAVAALVVSPGAEPALSEQITAFRTALVELGSRFNLLSALSSLPVGIPSLMAMRMPLEAPLPAASGIELPNGLIMLGGWLLLSLIGVGLGSLYHIGVAHQVAPKAELVSAVSAWSRMAALSLGAYLGALSLVVMTVLAASVAALLVPLLGVIVGFMGFSLLFWAVVYLVFTPHGIIRSRLGIVRSIAESIQIVRWNLLSTTGFLMVVFVVSYATNWVWGLPLEGSWYSLLAVLGHAFVSATLLASSYVFYQSRREWLVRLQSRVTGGERDGAPPTADA
jgi:hypothetical protein